MERVIVWQRWSPPSDTSRDAVAFAARLRIAARERFVQAEAEVVAEIGATAVFALDVKQLSRAIELCMSALRESEREEQAGMGSIACGIALGKIRREEGTGVVLGEVLDRAQALANQAGSHELLLDATAQAATAGTFLFAREISYGPGLSAAVLDRAFPRRSECQRAIAHLARAPFAANGQVQLESLRRLAKSSGRHRVLLVGPHGVGIGQRIARIVDEVAPSAWIDVRPLGASLAPLSGLMYALRRLPLSAVPEHVLTRSDEPDRHALATLGAIRDGHAVSRRDAVLALRQYIGRAGEGGRRPVLSVDPAPLIDPSTVGVVAEAARENGPDVLVIMRLLLESKPPEAFARGGGLSEIRVRGLSQHEARALAAAMMKTELPNDVARRAAAMGGSNPHAVAEALRVLISSGDVVFDRGGFRWRRGPAGRLTTMTLESLLEERIDGLAAPLRRALEVLATVPDPDDRALAAEVAARDGLLEDTWTRAVEELDALGFIATGVRGICMSPVVRRVTHATMVPARSLELNRFVTSALERRTSRDEGFARANVAYYLARAGRMIEAAEIFIDVAALAGELGFLRSGVRLAAAAVECDPSEGTRARAAQIAEQLSERHTQGSTRPRESTPSSSFPVRERSSSAAPAALPAQGLAFEARKQAVQALLARDFDAVERAIDMLVASGRDGAGVERLRTLLMLVKGDHIGAQALLDRQCERHPLSKTPPRLYLTSALVAIASGEVELAVRASLETLARTREARDGLGERASMCVLSMCYRRLGREADARRLARAALDARTATGT